jgi:hypothetical protein|nr:MAG TPA: hypothetical protein [Herelleviridae sp.]
MNQSRLSYDKKKIYLCRGDGWIIDIPGDSNIYFPRECAYNAIDKALGGKTRKANPQRHKLGIKVIGRKDDVS